MPSKKSPPSEPVTPPTLRLEVNAPSIPSIEGFRPFCWGFIVATLIWAILS